MKTSAVREEAQRERIFTFSVTVTGRCNTACSYCHYYATRDRKSVAYDISEEQFAAYMDFIRYWNETIDCQTYYRFSGGDPMVLGDRLFDLASTGLRKTGLRPFVLTAGKNLSAAWVNKARQSPISHVFVSVENPIRPDKHAPNPFKVAEAIRNFTAPEMPIVPGVCVVSNDCFKYLYQICEWFFKELGRIPLICEVNYEPYISPTEDEWLALEEALPAVIKDFFPKTQLNLFSSIVPEYAYGGKDPYVFDLNLENSHGIDAGNYRSKLSGFIQHLETANYPRLDCSQIECPWHEFCQNTKWYWQGDRRNSRATKLLDYCRFKRVISDAYYRVLVDANHASTNCSVGEVATPPLLSRGQSSNLVQISLPSEPSQ